jgi:hypothetical protein
MLFLSPRNRFLGLTVTVVRFRSIFVGGTAGFNIIRDDDMIP